MSRRSSLTTAYGKRRRCGALRAVLELLGHAGSLPEHQRRRADPPGSPGRDGRRRPRRTASVVAGDGVRPAERRGPQPAAVVLARAGVGLAQQDVGGRPSGAGPRASPAPVGCRCRRPRTPRRRGRSRTASRASTGRGRRRGWPPRCRSRPARSPRRARRTPRDPVPHQHSVMPGIADHEAAVDDGHPGRQVQAATCPHAGRRALEVKSGWPSTTSAGAPSSSGKACQMSTRWLPESATITRWPSVHTPRGAYMCDGVGFASGRARPPGEAAPSRRTGRPRAPIVEYAWLTPAGRSGSCRAR